MYRIVKKYKKLKSNHGIVLCILKNQLKSYIIDFLIKIKYKNLPFVDDSQQKFVQGTVGSNNRRTTERQQSSTVLIPDPGTETNTVFLKLFFISITRPIS